MRVGFKVSVAAIGIVCLSATGTTGSAAAAGAAPAASVRAGLTSSGYQSEIDALARSISDIRRGDSNIYRAGTTTLKKKRADELIRDLGEAGSRWRSVQETAYSAARYLQEAKKNSGWASASKKTLDVVKKLNALKSLYEQAQRDLQEADKRAGRLF